MRIDRIISNNGLKSIKRITRIDKIFLKQRMRIDKIFFNNGFN